MLSVTFSCKGMLRHGIISKFTGILSVYIVVI